MSERDTNVTPANPGKVRLRRWAVLACCALLALLMFGKAVSFVVYDEDRFGSWNAVSWPSKEDMPPLQLLLANSYVVECLECGHSDFGDQIAYVDGELRDPLFTAADNAFLQDAHRLLRWIAPSGWIGVLRDWILFSFVIVAGAILLKKEKIECLGSRPWLKVLLAFLAAYIPLLCFLIWLQAEEQLLSGLMFGLNPQVDTLPIIYPPEILQRMAREACVLYAVMPLIYAVIEVIFWLIDKWKKHREEYLYG